jgi:hypothetical protein
MIDQQVSAGRDVVPATDAEGPRDHSMDALQYGLAFLAILVAVLLASVR